MSKAAAYAYDDYANWEKRAKREMRVSRTPKTLHVDFFNFLEKNIDQVQSFYLHQVRHYRGLLKERQLAYFNIETTSNPRVILTKINGAIHRLVNDVNMLKVYCQVNRTAIRKILKKHDKVTGVSTKEQILGLIAKERSFFNGKELSKLIEDTQRFQSQLSVEIVRRYFRP